MPIKPENKVRYPANWREIRAEVLVRAKHRCEFCGITNTSWGWRGTDGTFTRVKKRPLREANYGRPPFMLAQQGREPVKIIEIVLTIAHLDHTPENCSLDNLKALCQKCHLTYDAEMHAQNARITRRAGKAVADMFPS